MTRALVLGGGGLIGMGFHAGALKALHDSGIDVSDADVVIGTSAGAVIGAYLASGWTPDDFYDYVFGRHPQSAANDVDRQAEVKALFTPLWGSRNERLRRTLGSAFVAASARGLWRAGSRGRVPSSALRKLFPAGLYSTEGTRRRFAEDIGRRWPQRGLYLMTADLYAGRRVAFGPPDEKGPEAPPADVEVVHADVPFCDAVLASTAIPGVFPPVTIGRRQFVDGGVVSATSVDLAVALRAETVLCVAPLGYRRDGVTGPLDPKLWAPKAIRLLFARTLAREVNSARARGVKVLVLRPWVSDLRLFGANSMRDHDRVAVVEAAYEGTTRLLDMHGGHPAVEALRRATGTREGP